MPLLDIKPHDRAFYESRLRDFLPEQMIDIHTHVWRNQDCTRLDEGASRSVTWPAKVAADNSIEDLQETYALLFPDKKVTPMIFGNIVTHDTMDAANAYVSQVSKEHHVPALLFSLPEWSGEEMERRIIEGGFLGIKSYLSYAPSYLPMPEIRIFDFFPHHQLDVLNRHGWILMLHLPRNGRLKDPVNLAQMKEINDRYPNMKTIIAHVGRAYCLEDVGNGMKVLAECKNLYVDFCANTNQQVFEMLIDAVGPKRILFGSDMPILRMRCHRIIENGRYVNLVPKGAYGDVSADPNMRELTGADADAITFFMYEEIDAFRRAAEAKHLDTRAIEDVFYHNAAELLAAVSH